MPNDFLSDLLAIREGVQNVGLGEPVLAAANLLARGGRAVQDAAGGGLDAIERQIRKLAALAPDMSGPTIGTSGAPSAKTSAAAPAPQGATEQAAAPPVQLSLSNVTRPPAGTLPSTPMEMPAPTQAPTVASHPPSSGQIEPGNIDVTKLPPVQNPDGSVSTVRSISINQDGKEYLIPTVVGGRVVSNQAAVDAFRRTGRHLGVFTDSAAADQFAEALHEREAARIAARPALPAMTPAPSHAPPPVPPVTPMPSHAPAGVAPPAFGFGAGRTADDPRITPNTDRTLGNVVSDAINRGGAYLHGSPDPGRTFTAHEHMLSDTLSPEQQARELAGQQGLNASSDADVGSGFLMAGTTKVPKMLSVELGKFPTSTARKIIAETKKNTGYSVNLATGEANPLGVYAGIFQKGHPAVKEVTPATFSGKTLQKVVEAAHKELAKGNVYLGTWDDVSGVPRLVYVEPSKRFAEGEVRAATKFAEGTEQKAVAEKYGPSPGDVNVFPVGNLHDFVTSPEFQQRLDDMHTVGAKVMKGQDWWSLVGGPLEQQYGKHYTRTIAGFLASTSPRTEPVKNARLASEYMRRMVKFVREKAGQWGVSEQDALTRVQAPHISQELEDELRAAIIQPEHRSPSTSVGYSEGTGPGAKMYDETSRTNNLMKAARGQVDALRADKVNDMAHALLGQLDVSVMDRRYAKLAEDPARIDKATGKVVGRGIYVDAAANVIAPAMDGSPEAYAWIQNAVKDAAKRHGVSEAEFSAKVWEGIGETIRSTGELYGVKHPAGAMPKVSMGFNVAWPKLVAEKAKAAGMSVADFTKKMNAGDAELLAALISTPVGVAAYKAWASRLTPTDRGQ